MKIKWLGVMGLSFLLSGPAFSGIRVSGETEIDLNDIDGAIQIVEPLGKVVVGEVPKAALVHQRISINESFDTSHLAERGKLRLNIVIQKEGKTVFKRSCEDREGRRQFILNNNNGFLQALRLSFKTYILVTGEKGLRCTVLGEKRGFGTSPKSEGAIEEALAPVGTPLNDPTLLEEILRWHPGKNLLAGVSALQGESLRKRRVETLYSVRPIEAEAVDTTVSYVIENYVNLVKSTYSLESFPETQQEVNQLFAFFVHRGVIRTTDVDAYKKHFSFLIMEQ